MNKLKSQVTMLMIVGLVILIIVSFVIYLSKYAVKKQGQQNIKRSQEAFDTQPIKEFVAKCFDKLAKDAIALLGKQGGYLYASQGGTIVDYSETDEGLFFVKYNGHNVAYNILPPKFDIPPYSSNIPDYPWGTFPYATAASNEETFEGFFGVNNMPPLEWTGGPNSIQTQIETFIDKNMISCANFGLFEEQGFEVVISASNTSVVIGINGLSVKSRIPIRLINPTKNEVTELNDFSTIVDVGLMDMYLFIKNLVDKDVQDIKFNISDIKNYKDFVSVKLIKNVFSNDDLVIVTDEDGSIYGKPFEYVFARRNRAPALYYIKNNLLEFPHLHGITQEDLLGSYTLKAEDPDEDEYTFKITPALPRVLNVPQIKFKVEIDDARLGDYQIITVNRR